MTMTDMLWRSLRISVSLAIFVLAVSWTVSLALLVAGCRSGQDVKVTDLVSEPIHFAGEIRCFSVSPLKSGYSTPLL